MKEIQNFIIEKIDNLKKQFSNMSFVYGYDNIAHQHIIIVQPDICYNNEDYMLQELDIVDEFISLYPSNEILFTNNNSFIKITNPIYSVKEDIVFLETFSTWNSGLLNSSLIPVPEHFLKGYTPISFISNDFELQGVICNYNNSLVSNEKISLDECTYAMAA